MDLIERLFKGERRALSRLMTIVENDEDQAYEIIKEVFPRTGNAHIIGVTGSPGVGKSTFVDQLATHFLEQNKSVGIIAVDPSSAFTGGAILGDRVRMSSTIDERLFFRSVGSRGNLGGLSRATGDMIRLLDAFGKDIIIIETVGTGQSEIDIIHFSHSIAVLLAPGMGDEVQAFKAGIMEIGDLFIVNKSDQGDAKSTIEQVKARLHLSCSEDKTWHPPVLKTAASKGVGISDVVGKILDHAEFLQKESAFEGLRTKQIKHELSQLIKYEAEKRIIHAAGEKSIYEEVIQSVMEKTIDPYSAANKLIHEFSD